MDLRNSMRIYGKISRKINRRINRSLTVLMILTAFLLCSCGNRHEAEFRGHYLYIDGEKYVEAGGLYDESNIKIGKTPDKHTIYEVVGDPEHNYVVSRSFLDQFLYVKESYTPDKTSVTAVCFGRDIDDFIYDEKIIDCILSFGSDAGSKGEFINGNEELLQIIREEGKAVYVQYGDVAVGEFAGFIFPLGGQYMYYSDDQEAMIEITDEQVELLHDYLELSPDGHIEQTSAFHIKMLKSGKADTALLYMEGETEAVVIDTGEEDDGPEIVEKLEELGITRISRLIITHYDKDHIGGAAYVLEHIPVGQVIQPGYPKTGSNFETYKEAVNSYVNDICTVSEDMDFSEGQLSFSIYAENDPENQYFDEGEDNDRSLVIMVSYQGKKFLFTGDIEEKRIELLLVLGADLSCDWIKIPHHGGFNNQTEDLLKAAGAKDGVICCSEKNPADQETLDAVQRAGMTCWLTADGDITFTCDGESIYGDQK